MVLLRMAKPLPLAEGEDSMSPYFILLNPSGQCLNFTCRDTRHLVSSLVMHLPC